MTTENDALAAIEYAITHGSSISEISGEHWVLQCLISRYAERCPEAHREEFLEGAKLIRAGLRRLEVLAGKGAS